MTVTGELKSKIDSLWDDFWSGGISNPLEIMEQLTYLLFIRGLDAAHPTEENKANRLGATVGLLLGFLVWSITLLVPSFVRSGWMSDKILHEGVFGIPFLKPLELFGLVFLSK